MSKVILETPKRTKTIQEGLIFQPPDIEEWMMSSLAGEHYDLESKKVILAALTAGRPKQKQGDPLTEHMPNFRVTESLRKAIRVLLQGRAYPGIPWKDVSEFSRDAVWLQLLAVHEFYNRENVEIDVLLTEHELILEEAMIDVRLSQVNDFMDSVVKILENLEMLNYWDKLLERLHHYDMRIRRMGDEGWRKIYRREFYKREEIVAFVKSAKEKCPDGALDGQAKFIKSHLEDSQEAYG